MQLHKEQSVLIFQNILPSIFLVSDHILYSRDTAPLEFHPRDSRASQQLLVGLRSWVLWSGTSSLTLFRSLQFPGAGNQILNKINHLSAWFFLASLPSHSNWASFWLHIKPVAITEQHQTLYSNSGPVYLWEGDAFGECALC